MGSRTPSLPTDPDDLRDPALVERFHATGEMWCIEKLWERYAGEVYHRCLRFLRDRAAAEDVTADVFVKVMRNLRTQYQPDHFKGWLFTIAKHECVNRQRRAAERLHAAGSDDFVHAVSADPSMRVDVLSVLDQLSAPQRIVIKEYYGHGYSYKEIAHLERLSLNEVKSHVQNGRRMFQKLWVARPKGGPREPQRR
jgi:RNA polymerase sigma factor (sigma-70 family)